MNRHETLEDVAEIGESVAMGIELRIAGEPSDAAGRRYLRFLETREQCERAGRRRTRERGRIAGAAQVDEDDVAGPTDARKVPRDERGVVARALTRSASEDDEGIGLSPARESGQNGDVDRNAAPCSAVAILIDLQDAALHLLGEGVEMTGLETERGRHDGWLDCAANGTGRGHHHDRKS